MDKEERLTKQFSEFQQIGKENKNVDVAMLMMSALQNQDKNAVTVPAKWKRWAYLISLGLPPLGLLFALKYYFGEEEDGRHVALICTLLTVVGGLLAWAIFSSALSSSGTSLQQIEQINPQTVQSTLQ